MVAKVMTQEGLFNGFLNTALPQVGMVQTKTRVFHTGPQGMPWIISMAVDAQPLVKALALVVRIIHGASQRTSSIQAL